MADEFRDYVSPTPESPAVSRQGGPPVRRETAPAKTRRIDGRIVTVHRGRPHSEGEHLLDVTVGGDEHMDIVVRVSRGAYGALEGKDVSLYIEE